MSIFDPKTNALLQKLMKLDADEQFVEGDLEAFFENPGLWRQLSHGKPISLDKILVDRSWWMKFVLEHMGGRGQVSPVPHINGKQQRALERYNFQILNSFYGRGYACPDTFQFPDPAQTKDVWTHNHPQDCWMAVENIRLPQKGESEYQNDQLCADLGIKSRLDYTWGEVTTGILPRVAELMGFEPKRVSLMSWEEWSFFGNLIHYIHNFIDYSLVPFVSPWRGQDSDIVEWCKNVWTQERFVSQHSLRKEDVSVGYVCMGSLDKLVKVWGTIPFERRIGFRVIIRLDKHPGLG